MRKIMLALPVLLLFALPAAAAPILPREPAEGELLLGQRVLVDDATCPAGQIKEVSTGNNTAPNGKTRLQRVRRCVKR